MSTNIAFDIIAHDRASRTFNNVGQAADRSSGKLKTFAKVGAAAVAGAAIVAGKALFDMTKAAIADEAAQAKLATQLRNSARATDAQVASVEEFIDSAARAYGVADDELRPAFGRLVAATHDVGKAQDMVALAMDVSAGTGKSLQSVTEALVKAQNGSVGGLARLGVATKDAAGETKSLDEITKDLASTYEGQASVAANTTEGKFRRLQVTLDETKEAIGARLIPVATQLADWFLREGVPALDKFGSWIDAKVVPALEDMGDWIGTNVLPVLRDFGGFIMDHVVPSLRELGEGALKGVQGFLENVGDAIEDNRPFLEAMFEAFKKIGTFIVDNLGPALGKFYEVYLPALGQQIEIVVGTVRMLVSALLKMGEWGVRAFGYLLDAAFSSFEGILDAAAWGLGWIPGIGDDIRGAAEAFANFRDRTVNSLEDTANKLRDVHERINGLPDKTVKINADTNSAAVALNGISSKIAALPTSKTIKIYTHVLTSGSAGQGGGDLGDLLGGRSRNARGTGYWRGGVTLVGEEGPEIVELPRGSRIHDAARSQQMARESGGGLTKADIEDAFARALARLPIVRLSDAGQGSYLQGAVL